jgi:hypothetical protein
VDRDSIIFKQGLTIVNLNKITTRLNGGIKHAQHYHESEAQDWHIQRRRLKRLDFKKLDKKDTEIQSISESFERETAEMILGEKQIRDLQGQLENLSSELDNKKSERENDSEQCKRLKK